MHCMWPCRAHGAAHGPVEFGPGVTIVGSVTLVAEEKTRVQNRTFEDVELTL